jgi:hemoglobin
MIMCTLEESTQKSLFDLIGHAFVERAVAEFYKRAFADVMIGHFFFKSDIHHITSQQIDFVTAMLGGPTRYNGKPLKLAHKPFIIRTVHFNRRQVLMGEVLTDLGLEPRLKDAWLGAEEQFRQVILTESQPCR